MTKRYGQLPQGKEVRVLNVDSNTSGVSVEELGIDSDSVLVSVFCDSTAGDLDIVVDTTTDVGQTARIITFPTISAPTANLVIKKADFSMDRVRITATHSAGCKFSVRVRGISAGAAGTDGDTGGSSGAGVSSSNIQNINLPSKNTEYTVVIPAGTTRFMLKSRQDTVMKVAYTATESGTNYWTVGYGVWYTEEGLDGTVVTLYIQASKDAVDLEVISWA